MFQEVMDWKAMIQPVKIYERGTGMQSEIAITQYVEPKNGETLKFVLFI